MLHEHLTIGQNGQLNIGGADICDLARKYGTPLHIMDETAIRKAVQGYKNALKTHYPATSSVLFASKALCFTGLYRILKEEGAGADVVSGGEMYTALKGSMPASDLYFHGNNKSEVELRYALENDIGCIVIDNVQELQLLERICRETGKKVRISFRIKPGVEAHTHDFVKTGQIDSKFGAALETGEAFALVEMAQKVENFMISGLHCHIGSQIFSVEPYQIAAERLLRFMQDVNEKLSINMNELNIGGGYGIPYRADDEPLPTEAVISQVCETIIKIAKSLDMPLPHLVMEPGRSLVGAAGITVYTVGSIKHIPGIRTYVSVDGGMGDNPRYTMYQAKYSAVLPERPADAPVMTATIAGRYCETDILGTDFALPQVKPGDYLAILSTGAYNYSMASHYNRVPRLPIIMVRNGVDRLVVRRETWEDMIANDIIE